MKIDLIMSLKNILIRKRLALLLIFLTLILTPIHGQVKKTNNPPKGKIVVVMNNGEKFTGVILQEQQSQSILKSSNLLQKRNNNPINKLENKIQQLTPNDQVEVVMKSKESYSGFIEYYTKELLVLNSINGRFNLYRQKVKSVSVKQVNSTKNSFNKSITVLNLNTSDGILQLYTSMVNHLEWINKNKVKEKKKKYKIICKIKSGKKLKGYLSQINNDGIVVSKNKKTIAYYLNNSSSNIDLTSIKSIKFRKPGTITTGMLIGAGFLFTLGYTNVRSGSIDLGPLLGSLTGIAFATPGAIIGGGIGSLNVIKIPLDGDKKELIRTLKEYEWEY